MEALMLFGSFVFLLLGNVPIAICLGLACVFALLVAGIPLDIISTNVYSATSKFVLLAVPFFILAGNTMEKTGISQKLINFAQSLVGHIKGGLAIVCVMVACFFAAISGSGPATVAALGMIIIPAMVNAGYKPAFSAALMATAGAIGVIIPPSITFVVYGSIAGSSIGKLFMAGVIPGILMGIALAVVAVWTTRKQNIETIPKASGKERWIAFKDAFWGLMMPVIILGGIYGGIFTPTEAAAVSAVYGLLVGLFIYKSIKLKDIYQILVDSSSQTAVVMLIMATASLFAWVMTVSGIAARATELLVSVSNGNIIIFLLIVNIILLIAGCFLDGSSALYIFTPIFLPVAIKLGYDPVALGVVMVVNLAIGMVTPPVGVNLYVACGLADVSLKEISKAVVPFIIASIIVLLLITYIPDISMLLPNLLD